jgi:hypothetical protein
MKLLYEMYNAKNIEKNDNEEVNLPGNNVIFPTRKTFAHIKKKALRAVVPKDKVNFVYKEGSYIQGVYVNESKRN